MNTAALKDLLYRLADDALILGHRNSEWTGLGPILEEDIAFSSMAQDQLGYALSYYTLLNELGEGEPDQIAFTRTGTQFRSCHLVEWPIEDYAFSLVRHVLFDYANAVRIRALTESSYLPLAQLAAKIQREQKYHLLHARTWFTQLGKGTEESRLRMQSALNTVFPLAFGIFESTEHTPAIAAEGIQPTEEELMDSWIDLIHPLTEQAGLKLPENPDPTVGLGGRKGYHTDYLEPLLNEMTVVFRTDPLAQW